MKKKKELKSLKHCFYPVQKVQRTRSDCGPAKRTKGRFRDATSYPSASRHPNERNKVDKRFEFSNPTYNILSTTISVNPTTLLLMFNIWKLKQSQLSST
jgi:hypothetical protein